MGKNDKVLKGYFRDKNRFADLFNGACFAGKQVIVPTDLEEASGHYAQTENADGGKVKRQLRDRDIIMRLKSGETLKLLAVENQNQVDYTMPFRCMQYDAMEYYQQIKELRKRNREKGNFATDGEFLCGVRKSDRITPIYTLCVYHGEEPWDGPRSLKDMMDFGEDKDEMSRLFADYPLHILCVNEKQDFDMFHTELRQLFRAMRYRRDKKGLLQLLENNQEYQHLDMETLEAMSVLLDIPQIWENREKYIGEENKEEGNMCQAIRELMEDARNEGMEQGIEQGIEQTMYSLVQKGLLKPEDAAKEINVTVEEFAEKMRSAGY